MKITVREAYRKGRASGNTQVEADVAHERFSRKYCDHPYSGPNCELDHAWWNGFEDSPYGDSHALKCPLGVANPNGHAECVRD